jgi:segregation and condensation protein B
LGPNWPQNCSKRRVEAVLQSFHGSGTGAIALAADHADLTVEEEGASAMPTQAAEEDDQGTAGPAPELRSVDISSEQTDRAVADSDQPIVAPEEATLHEAIRMAEAILFAASEPVPSSMLAERLPPDIDFEAVMARLSQDYAGRGVCLVRVDSAWRFRTADDLAYLLQAEQVEQRKLSRAALETLAIIAYHQPVTRAEIEDIRGVSLNKGVLDVLMELGWIRIRGRRRTPGRPLTFGSTEKFLDHFGLETLRDLPGKDDLKGAGLLDPALPLDFQVPPTDDHPDLRADEDPLEDDDPELSLHPKIEDDSEESPGTDALAAIDALVDAAATGDNCLDQAAIEENTDAQGGNAHDSAIPDAASPDAASADVTSRAIRSLWDETALDRIRDQVLRRD